MSDESNSSDGWTYKCPADECNYSSFEPRKTWYHIMREHEVK